MVQDIVIVDLHNTDFDLILDIDTCSKLGIHLSGIPNPLTIHEQGEDNRDSALITVLPTIDYRTYLGLGKRLAKQLTQCEKIPVTQWCNLPNSEVSFDISAESLQQLKKRKSNRQNFIAYQQYDETTKQVNKWLQEGTIKPNTNKAY